MFINRRSPAIGGTIIVILMLVLMSVELVSARDPKHIWQIMCADGGPL